MDVGELAKLGELAETKLTKVDTIAQILRRERRAIESKKRNRELLGKCINQR